MNFKKGMRVKLTATGETLFDVRAKLRDGWNLGTVRRVNEVNGLLTIKRDNQKATRQYSQTFWEPLVIISNSGFSSATVCTAEAMRLSSPSPEQRIKELEGKLVKVAEWLESLSVRAEAIAADCNHLSLKDAFLHDAQNYAATAQDIRKVLK